jgi:hypothetical protein
MLHEKKLTNVVIEKIRERLVYSTTSLQKEMLYFNKPIGEYVGIKLHHDHPFLVKKEGQLTYPRGLGGQIIRSIFNRLQNKEIYAKHTINGCTFKAKLKKN